MRRRLSKYEQLVQQNKQDLLRDEKKIAQIELRLEKRQTDLVKKKRRDTIS
ncbi:FbpB family small basic protein [Ornithinibacillus gellani]|uniref:FbpB family small basic protein n=1 Tax=Ornithinibacillus gellani TaxID=2293253 RepID=UPI000F460161|nr:FbpB family small basic protein [Ornithinibacillus gellani]TQS75724.1 FbpB family small basic protein [Ornithinibacillus gellani]